MIYYNLIKNALEEIWWDWIDIKHTTLWELFKMILFSLSCIILFLFFLPIDILLSPLEIAATIYYFFKKDK